MYAIRSYYVSGRDDERDWYTEQLEGKPLLAKEEYSEHQQFLIDHLACWNDFKLTQLDADGFRVKKRTNEQSAWIDVISQCHLIDDGYRALVGIPNEYTYGETVYQKRNNFV